MAALGEVLPDLPELIQDVLGQQGTETGVVVLEGPGRMSRPS
jgi:hypothetical protein